jgi:hypothetical protein
VSSRLTLDYGMRFYWIQPQFDESSQTANFLPDQYRASDAPRLYQPKIVGGVKMGIDPVTGQTVPATYIGRIVPGTGSLTPDGVPIDGVFQAGNNISQGLYDNRGIHFGPRFGFGYDVFGNQKMVVRGGAGVFYDRPQGNTVFNLVQNPPTTVQTTLVFGKMQDIDPKNVLFAPPSLSAIDQSGKIPTTYAFNLGIQYKLPFDSVLDVSYVGNSSQHQLQQRSLNAPAYGAAYLPQNQDPTSTGDPNIPGSRALPVDFLRPYQGFGQIAYIEPATSSNYHSLQTSLNRRSSRGLLLGVNYGWSKALGTASQDQANVQNFGAANNADNRRANYGPLDFDTRHNFSANFVYELPKATQNKALGYAINDWQLSGIYHYVTGQHYNITADTQGVSGYTLTGTQNAEGARIVLLKDPGNGHSGDPYHMFDATAFALPSPGSTSFESGRNFLTRAPINALDLSLAKRFRFKERAELKFQIDAFNALNHTQFNNVNATFSGPLGATAPTNLASETGNKTGFGGVQTVRPPRNLQLSARIQF